MRKKEFVNRLEKYPDDYEILIGHHGYDNVSIDIDHNNKIIYIDGFFCINNSYIDNEKHNNSLKKADKTFKKVKFIR